MSKLPGVWPYAKWWDTTSFEPGELDITFTPQQKFEWSEVFHYGTLYDLTDMDLYVKDGDE